MEKLANIKKGLFMYEIVVNLDKTNCKWRNRFKEVYTESNLTLQNFCIMAFHSVYPYYLTLTKGGWFKWVKHGDGVVVQCPNPKDAVEMKVFKDDSSDGICVEVIRSRGECPKEYKKGDVFLLNDKTFKFCPNALDAFVPYIELLSKGGHLPWIDEHGRMLLICPNITCGNAEFFVRHDK